MVIISALCAKIICAPPQPDFWTHPWTYSLFFYFVLKWQKFAFHIDIIENIVNIENIDIIDIMDIIDIIDIIDIYFQTS